MSRTTRELLSPPEDVVKAAQDAVTKALQEDHKARTNSIPDGEAFIAGLKSEEVSRKADEDIKKLVEIIRTIRVDFRQVGPRLEHADRYAAIIGTYRPLYPKWTEIYASFEMALQASVRMAPLAVDTLNTVEDILGGATESMPSGDLLARLRTFMTEVTEREQEALGVKNQFQNVVDRLRIFWSDVEEAMHHPLFNTYHIILASGLHFSVKDIEARLEALQNRMAALQQAIVSNISSGGFGAALTIFQLCPSAFVTALERAYGSGSSVISLIVDAQHQKDALNAEMEKTRQEILALAQDQEKAADAAYLIILDDPKRYLDGLALELDAIINIWQTINLDLHALYTDLSNNMAEGTVITKFWLAKIKVSKELYASLSWMCNLYWQQMGAVIG